MSAPPEPHRVASITDDEIGARDRRVLVLAHTHWDREWYRTAGEFRLALVALVDEVLDGRGGGQFLLDGQSIVLQDYLELRAGRREELVRALRDGGLEAGPWFVLADTLIPGGEALVRNLLAGRAVLRALGAAAPPVLYCPDSFGHTAALPLLAEGFALPVTIVWRGHGGVRAPAGDTVRWRHASGAESLLFHLPRAGYEFGSSLPPDAGDARRRWERIRDELSPRSTFGLLLLQNGADHHAVQDRLDEALEALARGADPLPVERSTLRRFAERLRARAAVHALPTVNGERRDSTGHTWALQGTFAARAAQKRANAQLEQLLVREVEPRVALARWQGGRSRVAELSALWRQLLECHPHDTLCGCSIDEVAEAMDLRLGAVRRAALLLAATARHEALGHDPVAARESPGRWRHVVVAWNDAPRAREGVAELDVEIPIVDIPVGPGSARFAIPAHDGGDVGIGDPTIALQLLSARRDFARVESPRHYPRNTLVERRRYLAWLPEVAPYGTAVWPVESASGATVRVQKRVRVERGDLVNESLRVGVTERGIRIAHVSGRVLQGAIGFEDVGERGDLYTHAAIPATHSEGRLIGYRLTMRGPLRGELHTRWSVSVAAREVTSATGEVVQHPAATIRIDARIQLDAGASFVRVSISGRNVAPDHRLRLLVRTAIPVSESWSDAAFGNVARPSSDRLPPGDAAEATSRTAPLHRYVSCFEPGHGVTLYSDGLGEQEVRGDGTIAVTLVRATGELSRHDLAERPGHAGWPQATPGAQSLGAFEGEFALLMHGGRTDAVLQQIEEVADEVLRPLRGASLRSALQLPVSHQALALEGEGLAFSACKESEDGGALVLRCVNRLARPVEGAWRLSGVREAQCARLDETPVGELVIDGDRVRFVAGAHAVVTVLVRGGGAAPSGEPND